MAQDIYVEGLGEAYQLFHKGVLALAEVEEQGLRVDLDYIDNKSKILTRKIKKLEEMIYDSDFFADWQQYNKSKVNIYSPKQMGAYLYKKLGITVDKKTTSGEGSTDEETLAKLGIPELDMFLEIKKIKKLRDTYLAGFLREQVDGFIHPFFTLHLVRTFRGASSNPNFQNIPKRDKESMRIVRQALYPRVGNQLMELDYGQLEVRISACYHLDPTMITYIETGHDMHADIAKQVFGLDAYDDKIHSALRGSAKNGFVFAEFYGDYFVNCAKNIAVEWCKLPQTKWKRGQGIAVGEGHVSDILINAGIKEYGEIKRDATGRIKDVTGFLGHLEEIEEDFWNNRFPVYTKWKKTWWETYQKNGYFVSKTGFLYRGVMSRNDAINYPVQGAAFHVLLWSLIRATETFKQFKMRTRIVGQIHDAIVLDVYPPERDDVISIMQKIMERDVRKAFPWIIVPLQIDCELCPVDTSWADKQKYKI